MAIFSIKTCSETGRAHPEPSEVRAGVVEVVHGALVFKDLGVVTHIMAPGTWLSVTHTDRTEFSNPPKTTAGI